MKSTKRSFPSLVRARAASIQTMRRPLERCLTAYTYYYNHLRGYQPLNNQLLVEQLEDSI